MQFNLILLRTSRMSLKSITCDMCSFKLNLGHVFYLGTTSFLHYMLKPLNAITIQISIFLGNFWKSKYPTMLWKGSGNSTWFSFISLLLMLPILIISLFSSDQTKYSVPSISENRSDFLGLRNVASGSLVTKTRHEWHHISAVYYVVLVWVTPSIHTSVLGTLWVSTLSGFPRDLPKHPHYLHTWFSTL